MSCVAVFTEVLKIRNVTRPSLELECQWKFHLSSCYNIPKAGLSFTKKLELEASRFLTVKDISQSLYFLIYELFIILGVYIWYDVGKSVKNR